MTFLGLSGLISAISCLVLGLFVYFKNKWDVRNQTYFFFDLAIFIYGFSYFMWQKSKSPPEALFWFKFLFTGIVLINATFINFIFAILGSLKRKRVITWTNHLLSGTFIALNFSDLLYSDLVPRYGLGLWPTPTLLFSIYLTFWFFQVFYGLKELYKAFKPLAGLRRTQLQYVFWSAAVGYFGGATNWPMWYGFYLPPYLNILIVGYAGMLAYAILKHRLMDIEVVIKKTLVFAGIFSVLMSVVAIITTLMQRSIGNYIGINNSISMALSIAIAIFLYDPIRKFLVNVTDRYLFQKKEDFKIILNRLSQNIITILDIDKVGQTILSTLKESLRLESGVILIKDEDEAKYKILHSFGIDASYGLFQREDALIQFLLRQKELFNLEDPNVLKSLSSEIREKFQGLKANECLPLFLFDDLTGAIILGRKKSDQEFTQDEMDYFPTIASQTAIALSNARLFDIQKKNQIEMAQQAKMAAIGTLSAGISHEVKNPLNNIAGLVDMFLINHGKGVYNAMTKEDLVGLVLQIMKMIKDNVARANGVIERLSVFVKKPKELKIERVRLEDTIEGALAMLTNELNQNSINFEKKFMPGLPFVMADLHALEEVFFNLIVNARHAIKKKGTITISTLKHNAEVEVAVQDTGAGISEENLGKIFDPFFTTKDTSRNADPQAIKGTGLGLHLVKEIIKRYGGRITVESTIDKGTIFHVFLPTPKECLENV